MCRLMLIAQQERVCVCVHNKSRLSSKASGFELDKRWLAASVAFDGKHKMRESLG